MGIVMFSPAEISAGFGIYFSIGISVAIFAGKKVIST
jgi:hypothetical protein